ncbi:hypothetical protein CASFOL_004986 [Castilleja foliolosa]|uniref:Lipid-binding serum glycoprotein C-terminal domain-containing protein n=1 Tax=Castilleja foliolosa TaxID=1961234 RepID=A0ABD3E246_9LAMI
MLNSILKNELLNLSGEAIVAENLNVPIVVVGLFRKRISNSVFLAGDELDFIIDVHFPCCIDLGGVGSIILANFGSIIRVRFHRNVFDSMSVAEMKTFDDCLELCLMIVLGRDFFPKSPNWFIPNKPGSSFDLDLFNGNSKFVQNNIFTVSGVFGRGEMEVTQLHITCDLFNGHHVIDFNIIISILAPQLPYRPHDVAKEDQNGITILSFQGPILHPEVQQQLHLKGPRTPLFITLESTGRELVNTFHRKAPILLGRYLFQIILAQSSLLVEGYKVLSEALLQPMSDTLSLLNGNVRDILRVQNFTSPIVSPEFNVSFANNPDAVLLKGLDMRKHTLPQGRRGQFSMSCFHDVLKFPDAKTSNLFRQPLLAAVEDKT